ncbi:MAG: MgtC/SapB family protein [Bacillota bacterium]
MPYTEILLRFAAALIVSAAIGWERESAGRPAGLRTHVLVGFSACLVMLCGSYLNALNGAVDPTRIAAQVVSGIGFLGAGTIMHEGATIKGLTTAATLWAVGCIGIAAGAGFYVGALVAGAVALVSLIGFERIERIRGNKSEQRISISLEYFMSKSIGDGIQPEIHKIAKEFQLEVRNFGITTIDLDARTIKFELVSLPKTKKVEDFDQLAAKLAAIPSVKGFSLKERNI